MNVTERLAHMIVETTYRDLPGEAVAQGKRALLDTIGVTLAGYGEASAQVMMDWVAECGARPVASVLGSSTATSPALAALANGTMGHALDFDDVTFHMRGHPSAPIAPVALALGEATGASGADVPPAPWRPAFCHGRATYSSLAAGTGAAAAARGKKAAFFFLSTFPIH